MMHLKRKDKEREKKKGKPKSTQRMLSDSLDKQDKNMEVAELKRKFDRLAVREDEPTSVKKLKLKLDTTEEEFASQSVESEIEEIGLDTGRIDNSVANYDYDAARIDSGEYLDAHDEEFDETGKKLCVLDSCLPSREWYRPSRLPRWLSAAEYAFTSDSFPFTYLLEILRKPLCRTPNLPCARMTRTSGTNLWYLKPLTSTTNLVCLFLCSALFLLCLLSRTPSCGSDGRY